MPALRLVDAETAHRAAVLAARAGLVPQQRARDNSVLRTRLWGRDVANPVGLAAGFDKDGEAVAGCLRAGFGMVEIGSVTPQPQPGNPRPRVFRLPEDGAVVNRYGFNSRGHAQAAEHLSAWRASRPSGGDSGELPDDPHLAAGVSMGKNFSSWRAAGAAGDPRLLGVNLGKNKARLHRYAMLCCAVLCCAALRCAALRCATLCYAMLCYALLRRHHLLAHGTRPS
jgi:hypothetical protein